MAATVLIIDDEPDVQTYLATLLEKEGYTVATAGDGEEGFTTALVSKPNLIFLDIMMPKKTGIMQYRRIRKEPTLEKVPIVILTGLSQYKNFFAQDFDQIPHPEALVAGPGGAARG